MELNFNTITGDMRFAPRMNIGGSRGRSYDEFMPESGVIGDVDIVRSLTNDSVPIMNAITGGYLYSQHSPVHSSHSFGFGLSGIGLSSLDDFGRSASWGIISGLVGYGTGRLLQSVGAGEFWSSLGGSLVSMYTSDQVAPGGDNSGLSSLGHISESHNGQLLEVELVGFDRAQFNAEVRQIKEAIFERAVAEGISESEAREIAEIQAEEIAEEIVEFKKKTNEVEALAREAKEASSVEVSDQVDSTLSPDQTFQAELLLNRPLVQSSETEDMTIGCLDRLTFARLELSPREQVEAMIPRNKAEAAMPKATLLRYDMEDFIARHPNAAKWCGRIFIGSVYTLQFAEYAGVAAVSGPIGVGGRFAIQETAGHAIEHGVDASSQESARLMTDNPILQQEFADTLKCTAYAGLCIGSAKASKKLVSTLTKNAVASGGRIERKKSGITYENTHLSPQT